MGGTAYGMEIDDLPPNPSSGGGIKIGTSNAPYGNGFAYAAVISIPGGAMMHTAAGLGAIRTANQQIPS